MSELDATDRKVLNRMQEDLPLTPRPFAEVASLLGFSHVESFHRAFKRWTGTTPLAHRARRQSVV